MVCETAQRLDATARAAVAKSITDAVHDVIGSDLNLISVVLHELQQDQIWPAGQPSPDVLILCYIRAGRPVHASRAFRIDRRNRCAGYQRGQTDAMPCDDREFPRSFGDGWREIERVGCDAVPVGLELHEGVHSPVTCREDAIAGNDRREDVGPGLEKVELRRIREPRHCSPDVSRRVI